MKPFNLERALAGDPVRCRDESITVVRLIHMSELKRADNLLVVARDSEDVEYVSFLLPCGTFKRGTSSLDLFMVPKKVTKWINFYKNDTYIFTTTYKPYETMEDALNDISEDRRDFGKYHSTVPVEIEL